MTKPVDSYAKVPGASGNYRTVKLHSYVVTLTEIGGDGVAAIRMDGYQSKVDLYPELRKTYEGRWKIKGIQKLYDEDFER